MSKSRGYWKKRLALEDDETIKEIEEAVLERSIEAEEEEPNNGLVHISQLEDEIMDEYKNWGQVKGLLTGLPSLDEKIRGMDKGHVILVGGETSMGKSALAANIITNVAKEHTVLFITLEMLSSEIGSRIAHINGGTIDGLDIIFQEKHRMTYKDLKPLIQNAIEMGDVKLICLDYLQYLGRGMTEKEVAIMSKEIKTLALEFKIPFIVITSLRKSEGGKNKRKWTEIEIEDYMGTGAIGYDCDVALVVSRKDLNNVFDVNHIFVKVLKVRNGKLDYDNRFVAFDWNETRITENWTMEPKQLVDEFSQATTAGENV